MLFTTVASPILAGDYDKRKPSPSISGTADAQFAEGVEEER